MSGGGGVGGGSGPVKGCAEDRVEVLVCTGVDVLGCTLVDVEGGGSVVALAKGG